MIKKICLIVILLVSANANLLKAQSKKWVIGYYMGDEKGIAKYPLQQLTHLIYSFLRLDGDTIAFIRPQQKQTLQALVALKKNYPALKILVSLGGWGGCAPCSAVFSSEAARQNFAASVNRLLVNYGADGLDLDWEYPGIEGYPGHTYKKEDTENFTALVKTIRQAIGEKQELSFAAGGFTSYLQSSVNWAAVMPYVNRVNLMTYDLVNGYSKITGHHTALHATAMLPEATDHCVETLLQLGVPAAKLVIGAAFYARVWSNVPDLQHGLYQAGEFKTSVDYKDLEKLLSKADGFTRYWDTVAMAPYYYSAAKKEFATYDDKKSIAAKCAYVLQKKLGGIMFWELTEDTPQDGLLNEIDKTFRKSAK
jgi:chitinase